MPGFEPQTDVHVLTIPADAALEQTPTITELNLLSVPDNANFQVELLSVSFTAVTLPVDSACGCCPLVDIEWVDDSSCCDCVANLQACYNLATSPTARVNNEIWRGSQILDAGDTVNAEFSANTPTTASEGAAFIVEYRILRRS